LLECLEDRTLPSIYLDPISGLLTVLGTPDSDGISIFRLDAATLGVSITGPGGFLVESAYFPVTAVTAIHVDAGAGDDVITLDVWGTGIVPDGITIETGDGDDVVHILSIPSATSISNSGGLDSVDIGSAEAGLGKIAGPLTFATAAGASIALSVDDAADTEGRTATLSAGSLTGLSPAAISWDQASLAALTIQGGSGGNTFLVTGIPVTDNGPVPTALSTGSGDDTVDIQSASPLDIDGQAGNNTLIVEAGDSRVWQLTAINTGFVDIQSAGPRPSQGLPPGPGVQVNFANVKNLDGELTPDTYVFNNGGGVEGTIRAGGGSGTLDYSAYSSNVIVSLPAGRATGVYGFRDAGISGFTTVRGGQGGTGTYNILVGDGGDVLYGGSDRRNFLIAGQSSSRLYGSNGDDILIGGRTDYDNNINALVGFMTVWMSDEDASIRAARLQDGSMTGGLRLDRTTVHSNNGENVLRGHSSSPGGHDLFFARFPSDTDYDRDSDIAVDLP
jgi:hypothetical protein